MTGREFTQIMYCAACETDGPQPMTIEEAAYNLQEYREEEKRGYYDGALAVPPMLTPKLFAAVWNSLYEHDTGIRVTLE